MMVIKCDICGFPIIGQQNFCSGCGVDLREPKAEESDKSATTIIGERSNSSEKNKKEKAEEDKFRIIKWCWIRSAQLPYVLVMLCFLAKGRSELGFCDCAICKQGYREILALVTGLSEKRKVSPASREIVKKAQEVDITKITFNISELMDVVGSRPKTQISEERAATNIQSTRTDSGKIVIELDDSIFERAVMKVLMSEEGQNLIKKASVRQKRKKKDSE